MSEEKYKVVDMPSRNRHSLWAPIVDQVNALPPGKALQLPLGGRTAPAFRAALSATAARKQIRVCTLKGPDDTLFIWKRPENPTT